MNVNELPANPEPIQLIYFRDDPPPKAIVSRLLTPVQGQVLRELLRVSTMTSAARAYGIHPFAGETGVRGFHHDLSKKPGQRACNRFVT